MSSDPYARHRAHAEAMYGGFVEMARSGDKRAADLLLASFTFLSSDPSAFDEMGGIPKVLLKHIATCISDWRLRGYTDAETWFWVERPSHRPKDRVTSKDIRAVRAYRLLMARGSGTVAARIGAAQASGLDEERVRYLVERKDEAVHARALVMIHPRHHQRVLNPPRKKYRRSR